MLLPGVVFQLKLHPCINNSMKEELIKYCRSNIGLNSAFDTCYAFVTWRGYREEGDVFESAWLAYSLICLFHKKIIDESMNELQILKCLLYYLSIAKWEELFYPEKDGKSFFIPKDSHIAVWIPSLTFF